MRASSISQRCVGSSSSRVLLAVFALLLFCQHLPTHVAAQYTIDPNEVSASTRSSWCSAEQNSCSLLCGGVVEVNDCTASNLQYACTCSNGSAPGLQYYEDTMPTFICQQAYQDCLNENPNNESAQANCTTTIEDNCGTLDPSKVSGSGGSSGGLTTSSASPTSSTPSTSTSTPSSTSTTSTTSSGGASTTSPPSSNSQTDSSPPTRTTPTSSSNNGSGSGSGSGSGGGSAGLSTGAKAGIAIGVVLGGIVIVGLIAWIIVRRRRRNKQNRNGQGGGGEPSDLPEVRGYHYDPNKSELPTTANVHEAEGDGHYHQYAAGTYNNQQNGGYVYNHHAQELAGQELDQTRARTLSPQELAAGHHQSDQQHARSPQEMHAADNRDKSFLAYQQYEQGKQQQQGYHEPQQPHEPTHNSSSPHLEEKSLAPQPTTTPTSPTPAMIASWTAAADAGAGGNSGQDRRDAIRRLEEEERQLDAAIAEGERIQRLKEQRLAVRQQLQEARGSGNR
ncbi:hypothetical protein F5Y16DRAFT_367607 [Xylariaceae sp. FL0255]|nr:hypothetical protein F5Y16DRAFT_367607 [Xylariaceae sp. FL0255]